MGTIVVLCSAWGYADETSMSLDMMPVITGQEDFVYVWTLGSEGVGDAGVPGIQEG